ncbi:hypothetical protein NL305_28300, partial [Klebsiella pneumoniae]|nr:hypothetical protein [Klebsiella pneumoniae]
HNQKEMHFTLPATSIAKAQVFGHDVFAENGFIVVFFTGNRVRQRSGTLSLFLPPLEIQPGFARVVESLLYQPAE